MPANIARTHNEFLRTDGRFDFASHDVGNRFVRMGVKRRAHSRGVVNFEECHLVALHERLHKHLAAVERLALDGANRHCLDVAISRFRRRSEN
jgi:hypothetical protein